MAREKKTEPEQLAGAPEWMVTFSDCMTLLLTFFVLLLSFSSFDDQSTMRNLKRILNQQPNIETKQENPKKAVTETKLIKYTEQLDKGSEKPTLETGKKDNLKKETFPPKFNQRKIFLADSKKIFWGNGTLISKQGQKTLTNLAKLLNTQPGRVVISENGKNNKTKKLGLKRACAVVSYLTEKWGLDKKMFSVSAITNLTNLQENINGNTKRLLEITLLERNVYN